MWPANPFMLGMLVRFPFLALPWGWVACLAGFAIAVPIMGCGLVTGAGLAAYNFGVVVIGYVLLSRVDRVDQRLKRLTSVFYLLFAVGAASIFAGIVGSILIGPLFHDPAAVSSFRYWFSVELLNQLAFLPMILSYPEGRKWWRRQLPPADLSRSSADYRVGPLGRHGSLFRRNGGSRIPCTGPSLVRNFLSRVSDGLIDIRILHMGDHGDNVGLH